MRRHGLSREDIYLLRKAAAEDLKRQLPTP